MIVILKILIAHINIDCTYQCRESHHLNGHFGPIENVERMDGDAFYWYIGIACIAYFDP